MTAKQKANRERFKKVVAEAKKLRKKNPKLTQAQAVKQAWAIMYSKKRAGVGAVKKKAAKKKAKPTKVKVKKGKASGEMHTDTKSHNVNIRVVSGIGNLSRPLINRLNEIMKEIEQRESVIISVINRRKELIEKNGKRWYDKWIKDSKKIVAHLKKEKIKLKSLI